MDKRQLLSISAAAISAFAFAQSSPEAIDLGLSVKWASCNLGAQTQKDAGNHYAWGETSSAMNNRTMGQRMEDISSNPTYDAATATLGDDWRMPTMGELRELQEQCKWEYTQGGYTVTGPNGNSIFLPAAGAYIADSLVSEVGEGQYWSATPNFKRSGKGKNETINDELSYSLSFNKQSVDATTDDGALERREMMLSIRPVYSKSDISTDSIVDLGLSVQWCGMNLGAASPEQSGDYFAWAETQLKRKFTRGNNFTYGLNIDNISGNPAYDAASLQWGRKYRIPTVRETRELETKCLWTWTTYNGENGYKVTGPSGKSIFLPAAGHMDEKTLKTTDDAGNIRGTYWTDHSEGAGAYYILITPTDRGLGGSSRYFGRSIRAVSEPCEATGISKEKVVNLGLSVMWASCNIGAERPELPGTYFAWGETTFKTEYTDANYRHPSDMNVISDTFTTSYTRPITEAISLTEQAGHEYKIDTISSDSIRITDIFVHRVAKTISGNPAYDAATKIYGESWRMPQANEIQELIHKCRWQWCTYRGAKGYKVTGPSGKSIFLPAAGERKGRNKSVKGERGVYWGDDARFAQMFKSCSLVFTSTERELSGMSYEENGCSIRAVFGKEANAPIVK